VTARPLTNRVELPGRSPPPPNFGLRRTAERSRTHLGPTWVNNVLLYAVNLREVGLPYKVFDIAAASLDGRTVGILAKDVVNFDWSPTKPTELFFVRHTIERTLRLWHVPIP